MRGRRKARGVDLVFCQELQAELGLGEGKGQVKDELARKGFARSATNNSLHARLATLGGNIKTSSTGEVEGADAQHLECCVINRNCLRSDDVILSCREDFALISIARGS